MSDARHIMLYFDPLSLPTAQHRAGLAGLFVHQETLRRRGIGPLIKAEESDGIWSIELTSESLFAAFNDLYDADTEERRQRQKRTAGRGDAKQVIPPKREERQANPKTQREETVYVYDQVVPRAAFLQALSVPEPWLKIWREAMWQVVRRIPKTRGPYEERSRGRPSSIANDTWKKLSRPQKAKARPAAQSLSGSLMLGAQAEHADSVPFRDLVRDSLLLHFWPIVMGTFVPVAVDRKGDQEFRGFVLTVPDVADVAGFRDDFLCAAATLDGELAGYRPRSSLIAVPEEAGLAYGATLARVAQARAVRSELAFSTAAVEVYHLDKGDRDVALLHTGRVVMKTEVLDQYDGIRQESKDPVYRRQRVLNLLQGRAWYANFDRVFDSASYTHFVGREARFFHYDVRRTLRRLEANHD